MTIAVKLYKERVEGNQSMKRTDMAYRQVGDEIHLYTQSPTGAAWIAKHLTTNIAETIHCMPQYGEELLADMREDGLTVVLEPLS